MLDEAVLHPLQKKVKIPERMQLTIAECVERTQSKSLKSPQKLFLPGLEEFMRSIPNHIARSSLFAPVGKGSRSRKSKATFKDAILFSRADAVIKFWGEQLDEAQADVWLQALHEAIKRPFGEEIIIKRAEFLRAIGRHTGGDEYRWLNQTMQSLTFAMLVIEVTKNGKPKFAVGKNSALHLIESFSYDDVTECYRYRIDPRWKIMYSNYEYSFINWEKRLQLRHDMAKSLQRIIATSDQSLQRHALDFEENGPPGLKKILQYSGRMRDFRIALRRAMDELERVGIIAAGRFEISSKKKEQAVWTRLPEDGVEK